MIGPDETRTDVRSFGFFSLDATPPAVSTDLASPRPCLNVCLPCLYSPQWLFDLSSLSAIGALGAAASMSLVGVVLYELVAVGGYVLYTGPHTTAFAW